MSTYTVIVDYDGGTYVSQFRSGSQVEAVLDWCKYAVKVRLLSELTDIVVEAVLDCDESDLAVLLDGLSNVYCFTASASDRLVLGHVILTTE